MVELAVNGKTYECPVGNKERKSELFYILKALNGDREARQVLLGDQDEYAFFIGKHEPAWLRLTKDSEEVITP